MNEIVIKTSDRNWLKDLADAYRNRRNVVLRDDANLGIDPANDTLLRMILKAKISPREIYAVLVSLGVAGFGAWIIVMAVLDPEPYSKVAATIGVGAVMVLTGGGLAVRILTNVKPPSVRVGPGGFEIVWD